MEWGQYWPILKKNVLESCNTFFNDSSLHCQKKEQACIIITGFYYFDTTLVCVMISGRIAHQVQNLNAGPEEQCS